MSRAAKTAVGKAASYHLRRSAALVVMYTQNRQPACCRQPSMETSLRAFALSTLCLAAATSGFTAQVAEQRPPAIRSGVTMVPIDARVVDRDGRPIIDLRPEEFTILEDGVAQRIQHFSTQAFTADASAKLPEPLWRHEAGSEVAPRNRRVFLVVVGRGRHQAVSRYIDALDSFVSRLLPQDQVALLAWNRATDFTSDHALLRRTIERLRDRHTAIETNLEEWFKGLRAIYGSKDIPPHVQRQIDSVFQDAESIRARPVPPAAVPGERAIADDIRRTMQDLQRNQEIAEKLASGASSVRDPVAEAAAELTDLTFEEYMEAMTETVQDLGNLYAGIAYMRHLDGEKHLLLITETGVALPRLDNHVTLARVASDARIALSFIQTGGTVAPAAPRMAPLVTGGGIRMSPWATSNQVFAENFAIQELKLLADVTGGQLQAFKKGDEAFGRLEQTLGFQYLLGYYPANAGKDGKYRNVKITVSRPGARVMHRQGYFASAQLIPLDRRQFVTVSRMDAAAALGRSIDHLKVTLAVPVVSPGSAPRLSVDVTVDIHPVKFTVEADRQVAALDVALYCGDAKDIVVCESKGRVELKLTDAIRERMLREGTTFRLEAPLKGAPRTMKVIVYDFGADRVGTATAKVTR